MTDKPLNFNPDDLGAFDRAPDSADDLGAFDTASGVTVIPPGWYRCRLESGELVPTKKDPTRRAYRLQFAVVEPAAHAGFALWRYYTFHDAPNANRAKAALAPLGLRTSAELQRSPFPEAGRVILCRVLVGMQKKTPDEPDRNDVIRFTVESDERDGDSAVDRFALPPDKPEGGSA